MNLFESTIYKGRRTQLLNKMISGLVLLVGNVDSPMNYKANTYPFRQDSTFLYYCGLDLPGLVAILDIEENEITLFGDDISVDDIVWTGPQPKLAELAKRVGITRTKSSAALEKIFTEATSKGRPINYLPPYRAERKLRLEKWLGIPANDTPTKASVELIKAIVDQRSIKSMEEIAEMEKAVAISKAMHVSAMQRAQVGQKEAQLAGIAEGIALGMDSRVAYPVIMTINGQTLHNHHHHNTLKKGQLVLGDFGAESLLHYAGDITRTFPVDKTFTAQQKEVYQIVLDAETEVINQLRPGITYREMHLLAASIITNGLKGLGLMKGDTDEAVAAGAHALFFPHGLGHMIGLDVHDMEDYGEDYVGYDETIRRSDQFGLAYLRLGRSLQEGFVLTVEPGIYFIPELIDQWKSKKHLDQFINYEKLESWKTFGGIRIEDNCLITKEGSRVLGPPIPKTIEEVEAIRNS